MQFKIRHFGFKVDDLSKSLKYYIGEGYTEYYNETEFWKEFGVLEIIKLKKKNVPNIELIKTNSITYNNHLCFEINDIDDFYNINKNNYKFIVKPKMCDSGNVKVGFYISNNLLFEVVENKKINNNGEL